MGIDCVLDWRFLALKTIGDLDDSDARRMSSLLSATSSSLFVRRANLFHSPSLRFALSRASSRRTTERSSLLELDSSSSSLMVFNFFWFFLAIQNTHLQFVVA